jgi:Lung seven transmembrane receptor
MFIGPSKYAVTAWMALLMPVVLQGAIMPYDLVLEPTDEFVHFSDGYIRAPGFIDLGSLSFTATSDAMFGGSAGTDDTILGGDDDITGGGGSSQPPRKLDGGIETNKSTIDIVIFRLPHSCVHSRMGCDWAELGVGNRSDDGSLRWCCTTEAVALGICEDTDKSHGRLMVNDDKFTGVRRTIDVPREGPMSKQIRYGKVEETESGTYVVLYANCNDMGREITVTGESVWKSKHGYLPGELFGFMYFYTVLTVVYFVLLVWYGISMYVNEEHRIEIERWIFLAIALGLLEMIFRTGDYFVWNADGSRSGVIIWIGVLAGVLKQGISRCLIVMVSLGWGVVRDSLGSTMRAIVVLGAAYIGVSAVRDLMIVFAIEDMNKISYNSEEQIFDIARILTLVVSVIDVIFIMWILDALNNTMLYLENMQQTRKLERYLKLRCLFLFSILFATIWAVFTLVDTVNDEGIVAEEHAWAIDAATEINYLFVLIGVALLWQPNPNAREYAYVMELPAMGTDGDNELELAGVVPSAADSDDGLDDRVSGKNGHDKNGFHDDPDSNDGRFQIS